MLVDQDERLATPEAIAVTVGRGVGDAAPEPRTARLRGRVDFLDGDSFASGYGVSPGVHCEPLTCSACPQPRRQSACASVQERPVEWWGLGSRWGRRDVGAIGVILGVYRQARTEGEPTDGLVPVCPVRAARRVPCRRGRRSGPRVGAAGDAGADRGRSHRADRRRPLRAHRDAGHRPQRVPAAAGRRPRPATSSCGSPSCARGRSSRRSSSRAAASTRPCTRW